MDVGYLLLVLTTFYIVAYSSSANEKNSTIEFCPNGTNPLHFKANEPSKTWSKITWALDACQYCIQPLLSIECVAMKVDNEDYPWIIRSQNFSKEYSTCNTLNRQLHITTNITNLSQFTNYTCFIETKDFTKNTLSNMTLTFRTEEDVPSAPENLNVTRVSSTGFSVSWGKPLKISGVLVSYQIIVYPINPQLYIADGCTFTSKNVTKEVSRDDFLYHFNQSLPNRDYIVKISASTRAGYGPAAEMKVITLPSAPEPPRFVKYHLNNTPSAEYQIAASLTWHTPCSAYGHLLHFKVKILGISLGRGSDDFRTKIIRLNNRTEDVVYKYDVKSIKASYNYTITLSAVLKDNTEGKPAEVYFTSPDGYPSTPTNITVVVEENLAFVTWNPPAIKNGNLETYRIIFTPKHRDCSSEECTADIEETSYVVPAKKSSFVFEKGVPNLNYTVTISASTSAGYGPNSHPKEFEIIELESVRTTTAKLPVILGLAFGLLAIFLPFGLYFYCITNNRESSKGVKSTLSSSKPKLRKSDKEYLEMETFI